MKLQNKIFSIIVAAIVLVGCQSQQQPGVDGDKLREYAGDLVNRSLYSQAVQVYQQYLNDYKIDDVESANVNYIIANLYFERIKNYEQSLTYLLKIKHLYPETTLMDEVNKKIVACLERLERTEDAQQAMEETVALDPSTVKKSRPGAVVARIGKREVTQGDLDFEISQLPPMLRDQLKDKEMKMNFLREYVATELLYETAQRAGLDKEPDIIEGAFQAKKSLMVRKLLEDRVAGKVEVDEQDVKLYYEAHAEDYAELDEDGNIINQKPLQEVQQEIYDKLTREKYQAAYLGLIEKMIMAEGVKFYENRVE